MNALLAILVIAGMPQPQCDLRHIGACEDAGQLVSSAEFREAFLRFARPRSRVRNVEDIDVWSQRIPEFVGFGHEKVQLQDGRWLIHGGDRFDESWGAFLLSRRGEILGFAVLSDRSWDDPMQLDLELFVRPGRQIQATSTPLRQWGAEALAKRIRQPPAFGMTRVVGPLRGTHVHYVAD